MTIIQDNLFQCEATTSSRSSPALRTIPLKRALSPPSPPIPTHHRDLSSDSSASLDITSEQFPPPYIETRKTAPLHSLPLSTVEADAAVVSDAQSAIVIEVAPVRRTARVRPPLPIGPRKPSGVPTSIVQRSRNGSVSSLMSTEGYGNNSARKASTVSVTGTSPKFLTTQVKFRGLTMDQAKWQWTQQELQEVVRQAIKDTSDASWIRVLPVDVVSETLPAEIHRLEVQSAELRTKYKLGVRRRRTILATLALTLEDSDLDQGIAARMLDELSKVSDNLDELAEELYSVTDQLGQLKHLGDVHSSSALAIALHKLNGSLTKHFSEVDKLRGQVAALEAERDEAWKQAQDVAQDFDDLADRMFDQQTPAPFSASRRSSRVIVARKTSVRASKAGLRSSYRSRSARSSVSSAYRLSTAGSPAARSAGAEIPPVPPIPLHTPLGIVTAGLPTQSSFGEYTLRKCVHTAYCSAADTLSGSPSSSFKAIDEAQKELCDMLGISMKELKAQQPTRRQSMSAAAGPISQLVSPILVRRNSEVLSPGLRL